MLFPFVSFNAGVQKLENSKKIDKNQNHYKYGFNGWHSN
jgi:hypothetical protein